MCITLIRLTVLQFRDIQYVDNQTVVNRCYNIIQIVSFIMNSFQFGVNRFVLDVYVHLFVSFDRFIIIFMF